MSFLPITSDEMKQRGWDRPDFVFVTGDAYVDHPSFGVAILSRMLEDEGFRVAILAQPNWRDGEDFTRFGRPRLGFLVTAGNIDSMVAHYTAARRKRSDDAYSPGNKAGKRPDRAVITYCKCIRACYPDIPIVIGGLEASLRRFAHYDYWADTVMPSILMDSGADLLTYGMGEKQISLIAHRLAAGEDIHSMTDILGTCYLIPTKQYSPGPVKECPSLERVQQSKREYAVAARIQQDEQDAVRGKTVIQRHGGMILVQNPPMPPLDQEELDRIYELPYERMFHPSYEKEGGVPAIQEVEFSITHNRGCFGACNFCSIAFHQGRQVTCRSEASVLREAEKLTKSPRFKGYIHDVGGPTANFRHPSCKGQLERGLCKGKKCLAPKTCPQMEVDHKEYLAMLQKIRALPKVKRVFIRSGIRFDYLMEDPDETFLKQLITYHVSGQLKVAPEHCSAAVLDKMGKPHIETYRRFAKRFYEITKSIGKKQYLVPYLMSSHPGSTLKDAVELALFLKKEGIHPEQVQDFYPTPGTISTAMFYTGLDPYTLKEVYVPKKPEEKAMQRALLQWFMPQHKEKVLEALRRAGRSDLIGTGPNCLVAPGKPFQNGGGQKGKHLPSGRKHAVGKGRNAFGQTKKKKGR